MSEHPILFCTEMVQAYLAGRKWQTRRVIKLPRWSTETWSDFELDDEDHPVIVDYKTGCLARIPCPYGQPSDTLWVRETWQASPFPNEVIYKAESSIAHQNFDNWRPPIFMPRWASRISFPIVSIRAERVQDISENDAEAEGVRPVEVHQWPNISDRFFPELGGAANYRRGYAVLWNTINAKRGYGWDSPTWPGWVWVIEFPKYGEGGK